jgi:pimeloyl-ACP methyl ester carboxylesterase
MQTILLLHGAIGASSHLTALAENLGSTYKVYTHDFTGHGSRPFSAEPFSIELFAADVLQFLNDQQLSKVSIFGYSMGGYVAMYLARHYPDRIEKVITLATKYEWTEAIATKEVQMLDPVKIELKLPAFAATLAKRHDPADWKEVLRKTADMMVALGANSALTMDDYLKITNPVLILLGDRDKMVSLDETTAVYRSLPNAQFGVLPATIHPIEQVDLPLLTSFVRRFLNV